MLGYIITQTGTLIAKLYNISSIRYMDIIIIVSVTVGGTLLIMILMMTFTTLPDKILYPVIMCQFLLWLASYGYWIYALREARIFGLFFAYMPLVFLITTSNLKQALPITIGVAIIQLGVSYYAINIAGQPGSFTEVAVYTGWFFPSALYIAYLAGVFRSKRNELAKAKRAAENAHDALWGEMELAKKIQTVLLPVSPVIEGFSIAAYMSPADEVGGDYYDVIHIGGKDWIVIGDVSGHGIPAGLIMMMVQTAIKSVLSERPTIPPQELLRVINGVIYENISKLGGIKYMTITIMAVRENDRFYFSGLHQDIMVYRASKREVELIETRGMWIGLVDNINGMMEEDSMLLEPGDVMFLYTDGITEAADKAGNLFSSEKLADLFKENGEHMPDYIKDSVLAALTDYKASDDVTMLILKRLK